MPHYGTGLYANGFKRIVYAVFKGTAGLFQQGFELPCLAEKIPVLQIKIERERDCFVH